MDGDAGSDILASNKKTQLSDLFAIANPTQIHTLSLDELEITTLPQGCFHRFTDLTELISP